MTNKKTGSTASVPDIIATVVVGVGAVGTVGILVAGAREFFGFLPLWSCAIGGLFIVLTLLAAITRGRYQEILMLALLACGYGVGLMFASATGATVHPVFYAALPWVFVIAPIGAFLATLAL